MIKKDMLKALVLGGNRYFGLRLVNLLLQRGIDVTVLNRGLRADPFGERVKRIRLDRRQLDKNHPDFQAARWDIVYDQICYDAFEAEQATQVFQEKTNRYIFISSQSVYGDGADLTESRFDPTNHPLTNSVDRDKDYGEAKRQAEAVFFQKWKIPTLAVRLPIVLGEDDYTERLKLHVQWAQAEKAIFFPSLAARISFIHAQDAALFLADQIQKTTTGPINCAASQPISLQHFVHELEKALHKKVHTPKTAKDAESSPFGLESDWYMNTDKLKSTGFVPAPILDWLPNLIEMLRR